MFIYSNSYFESNIILVLAMNKEEIIESMEKTKYWEDQFILKYDSDSFLELLKALPKDKYERIKQLLDENFEDTRAHAKALSKLIGDLKDG